MKRSFRFWWGLAALVVIAMGLRALSGAGAFVWLAGRLAPDTAGPVPVVTAAPAGYYWESAPLPAQTSSPSPAEPATDTPVASAAPAAENGQPAGALPQVKNGASAQPDYAALLKAGWSGVLAADQPQILILHTHGCEAYTPAGADVYLESDPFRTEDQSQNVVHVGDVLAGALEDLGFSVLHDRTLYDCPSYTGAYDRSGKAASDWLEQHPSLRVVIDLHRDSLNGYRTAYQQSDGSETAQVMLLLTTGEAGLYHPNWRHNLSLGLLLQQELETRYPGLARPLYLSPARYNQHLSPGSFILEVGSDANTLQEAAAGVELFAACAGAVLQNYVRG